LILWHGRPARDLTRRMRVPNYNLRVAGLDFEPADFGNGVFDGAWLVVAAVVVVLFVVATVFAGAVAGLNSLKPPARVSTHIALYCGCEPHEMPATWYSLAIRRRRWPRLGNPSSISQVNSRSRAESLP
jgi:hypothetical protein